MGAGCAVTMWIVGAFAQGETTPLVRVNNKRQGLLVISIESD